MPGHDYLPTPLVGQHSMGNSGISVVIASGRFSLGSSRTILQLLLAEVDDRCTTVLTALHVLVAPPPEARKQTWGEGQTERATRAEP